MEKTRDQNICIRQCRDEQQISRCKELLQEIDTPATDLARILHLVGNVVRMKILLLLRQEERLCVCDLSDILEMKIPAVSQHLRKMKDVGLVATEREGTTIFYHISPSLRTKLEAVFSLLPAVVSV